MPNANCRALHEWYVNDVINHEVKEITLGQRLLQLERLTGIEHNVTMRVRMAYRYHCHPDRVDPIVRDLNRVLVQFDVCFEQEVRCVRRGS